jgi:aminoglycoside 6'-N-acetyltransferase
LTPRADLAGEQVVLRPIAPADAPCLRAIHVEPAVAEWWGPMEPDFPDDEPTATRFAIVVEEQVAGLIQFSEEHEPAYRHATIDLFVATAHQGRGFGTDAIRTLVRHLVEDRGHHRITIDPAADNAVAIRCYEKAGFTLVGVMRAAWRDPAGTWRNALFMEHVEQASCRD